MRFCVVTHVEHKWYQGKLFAYGPYVQEMNLWFSLVEEVYVIAPKTQKSITAIDLPYEHPKLKIIEVPSLHLKNWKHFVKNVLNVLKIISILFQQFKKADHIHLRCPGNMGFLGALVQVVFPKIPKTVKYAGNWDPNSKQPLSYQWQKNILKNTFLSKNTKILIYGSWKDFTANCISFFTASYFEAEKQPIQTRNWDGGIEILFVGNLSVGKNPMYVIKLVEQLKKRGIPIILKIFGNGKELPVIEKYILEHLLLETVFLMGNQSKAIVKEALQNAHFLVLPSKSEGWPKVVAEAMFWGCIPLATPVSCVPQMMEDERGILLQMDLEKDIPNILQVLADEKKLKQMQHNGVQWSREFTFEKFTSEIQKFLSV